MYKKLYVGIVIILFFGCNNERDEFKSGKKIIYYNESKNISQIIDFNEFAEEDGYYISFDTLGNIQRIQKYSLGEPNGERLLFYSNGFLKSKTIFIEGKKEMVEYNFHENGLLESETVWKQGSFTGRMREYNEKGRQVFIHCNEIEKYDFCIVPKYNKSHGTNTVQTDSKGNVIKDTRKE